MCLSTVYRDSVKQDNMVMKNVRMIEYQNGNIVLTDLMERQTNPTIAPYAKIGEVHLRVTAKAESEAEADSLMKPVLEELYKRFGELIFTEEEAVTLEEAVIQLLREKGYRMTTAESCTGGRLAARLINVPGASDVYEEGYITYSNEAKKRLLGVKEETLNRYGAVSRQTAEEMARGAAGMSGTDAALSVTGIAGPDGGTEEKPVGLVYIGCYVNGHTRTEEFRFTGNRDKNRDYAVVRALTLIREELLG